MNHCANCSFVDAQSKSDCSHNDSHFVGGPALLILAASFGVHLSVVGDRRDTVRFEEVHRLFYSPDGRRIHNYVGTLICTDRAQKQIRLRP